MAFRLKCWIPLNRPTPTPAPCLGGPVACLGQCLPSFTVIEFHHDVHFSCMFTPYPLHNQDWTSFVISETRRKHCACPLVEYPLPCVNRSRTICHDRLHGKISWVGFVEISDLRLPAVDRGLGKAWTLRRSFSVESNFLWEMQCYSHA